MPTFTKVKLALALMGLIIFAAGVRFDDTRLRWTAIAFVALAWVMRFAGPRRRDDPQAPREGEDQAP